MSDINLEAICAEYTEAYQKGQNPQLKDWLNRVPANQQAELFRKLLALELSQTEVESKRKSLEDYLAEFPDFSVTTVQVFTEQSQGTVDWQPSPQSQVKLKIGSFRFLQVIGKGGMGTVWLAEREGPIKQRVAVKLIKGLDKYEEKLKRFDIERQALSLMNHINIARVVDLGSTETGVPYFAMEYVPGLPLTTYCNRNGLSLEERLDLFCQICDGVQHAHQKGIIHRDLKPNNILVTEIDGKAVPKIIDFGLAKAVGGTGQLVDHSLHTSLGQVVGSYLYMSPEQASGETLDIDTRTDIYSLGVILYELLTDRTPIEAATVTEKAIHKVLEIIREEEPVRPSKKLLAKTEIQSSTVTDKRRLEPRKLSRALESELDWIVMKSLEKNRTRRYETASSFSEDIRRYLRNEPILARPPSVSYVCSKFIRRHRTAVAGGAIALSICGIAISALLWSWIEIRRANIEKTAALEEAESTSKFWMDVLAETSPSANSSDISLQDTLSIAARKTIKSTSISDDSKAKYYSVLHFLISKDNKESVTPKLEAEMRNLLSQSQSLSDKSRSLLKCDLAAIDWSNNDQQKALQVYEEEVPKLALIVGTYDADYITCKQNLGFMLSSMGETERGSKILREVFEMESEDKDILSVLLEAKSNYTLQFVTSPEQRLTDLISLYQQSKEKLGQTHVRTLQIAQTIGSSANTKETVFEYLKIALEGAQDVYGMYHPWTQFVRLELLSSFFNSGSFELMPPHMEPAREFFRRQKLDLSQERFTKEHGTQYQFFQPLYAIAHTTTDRFDDVEPILKDWCDNELKDKAPQEKLVLYWRLSRTLLALNKLDEASQRISELVSLPDQDSITRYETESLTAQLDACRSLQQLRQENLNETEKVEWKTKLETQIQVLESLWTKKDDYELKLMSKIVARDIAATLIDCYTFLAQPERIELWKKRSQL